MSRFLICSFLAIAACFAADIRSGYYHGRPVTFENKDGLAVFQGDVILGNTAEIESASPTEAKGTAGGVHRESSTVTTTRLLWPGGVIPYVVDGALPSAQKTIVSQAIDHWNTRTPIRLVARTNEVNYVRFTTSTSTVACSSNVGMLGIGAQSIQLPTGCGVGETIHEIGHAVGLWHEQSRNDRNQFVTVLYENIDKPSAAQFDQTLDSGRDAGPYDLGSIMHYGPFDFARDEGLAAIPTLAMESVPAGIPFGQRIALSALDIDAVQRLYGKPSSKTTVAATPNIRTAADGTTVPLKLRVDGALVDSGTAFDWSPGSQHTIEAPFQGDNNTRFSFGSWSDGGDVVHTITAAVDTTVFVANFLQFNRVVTSVSPAGSGSITLDPPSPDGFYRERSNVLVTFTPASGYNLVDTTLRPARSLASHWTIIQGPTAISANFTKGPVTTFTSNPPARLVIVDSASYSTPVSFAWPVGSSHTVDINTTQPDFIHYKFLSWSDGGQTARTVIASAQGATYNANYTTQHGFTTQVLTRGGSISLNPSTSDGFYDEGTVVQLTANPPNSNVLLEWDGDLRGRTNPASVTVDGQKLVYASYGSQSLIGPFTVLGAASASADSIAPGEIVSLYGDNIGPSSPTGLQVANGRVTTQAGGVEVLFDGVAAPITYAQSNQINAVAPYVLNGKASTIVEIRSSGKLSQGVFVPVTDSAPGTFTVNGAGSGQAAVLNQDGSYNSRNNPAARNSIIVIYASGEGATNPQVLDGQVATSVYPKPVLPVSVRIGGIAAPVHYAGAAPGFVAGALQVNAQIPDSVQSGPNVPVSLVIGSQQSPSGVTIAVQ
jgi:uncharacterized protein (TIGR03437 family)